MACWGDLNRSPVLQEAGLRHRVALTPTHTRSEDIVASQPYY